MNQPTDKPKSGRNRKKRGNAFTREVKSIMLNVYMSLSRPNFKPVVILFSSCVLMLLWKYFGSAEFYDSLHERFPGFVLWGDPGVSRAVYMFSTIFVLLGIIPMLIVLFVFREPLSKYGVTIGRPFDTFMLSAVWVPIFIIIGVLSSNDPALQQVFPYNTSAGNSSGMFVFHIFTYLFFYAAWEFHFRGYMQLGLCDRFGPAGALLVQVMASSLLHIGHPATETFGAIAGGILWGLFVYRSKSLIPSFLQHAALGISLDWALCFLQ